jgi:hypothetical protein
MQHLDTEGGSMATLCDSSAHGVLVTCMSEYWNIMNSWHPSRCSGFLPFLTRNLVQLGMEDLLDQ